jgi:hypothetical protein
MTEYEKTDFDVVYLPASHSKNKTDADVYHVRTDCRYYKDAKTMNEWQPESLWDCTRLCKECQRLLESEES